MGSNQQLGQLPRPGDRIDRFRVVADIAHGGMAAVYAVTRADAPNFSKLLAMKVMLPHLVSDERFVAMFTDEARIAARISHPNVVQVFDVGEEPFPHLVLELVQGQSLSALLRHAWDGEPKLSRGSLFRILADAAEGLHAAHEACDVDGTPLNIVHRDVSPQNVLVGYDGQVKVVDFGVAAARGRIAHTRTGEIKGKIAFLAPEQLTGRGIDRRTDLWAFGVMAWQIFARQRLFRGETESESMWNVVHLTIPDLAELDPELPIEIVEVIHLCLERDVHRRPVTASAVAKVFRTTADSLPGTDRAALGGLLAKVFAAERATEAERLAAALRRTEPGPLREEEGSSGRVQLHVGAVEATSNRIPVRRRARVLGAAIAGLVLVLALGTIVYVGGSTAESVEPSREATNEELGEGTAVHRVSLRVAEDVETVLVDDTPHEERPVEVPVGSVITLIGLDRVRRHEVSERDHHSVLSVGEAAATSEDEPEIGPMPSESTRRAPRRRSRHHRTQPSQRPEADAPIEPPSGWMRL